MTMHIKRLTNEDTTGGAKDTTINHSHQLNIWHFLIPCLRMYAPMNAWFYRISM